jgi:hypothetical protein
VPSFGDKRHFTPNRRPAELGSEKGMPRSDSLQRRIVGQQFLVEDDPPILATDATVSALPLVVPGQSWQTVLTTFTWVSRDAEYNNELGLFVVDDASGRIGELSPADPGYAQAALSSLGQQVVFASGQTGGAVTQAELPGASCVAVYLIQNATTERLLQSNPSNQPDGQPHAFFSFVGANPDGIEHIRQQSASTFGCEDLLGGGDRDYNDLVFRVQFGTPQGVDDQPPTVVIQSPETGLTTDTNVTVAGQVSDDLSGVASLECQVDSESFFDVSFDELGSFSFDTTLPLDGSADGEHTVRLRATDQAGNVSNSVEVAFTLQTAGANRAITTDAGVQQMPSIAVNPLDSDHLVIAYMDYSLPTADAGLEGEGYAGIGVAVSHNAGDTWEHTSIPLPENFDQGAANPIAKFDDQGHVFVSFMAATFLGETPPLTNPDFWNPEQGRSDRSLGMQANNGVFVARSDDGGLTWNQPVAVVSHLYEGEDVFFEIIPDLAIDTFPNLPNGQPNPNYGNMYVAWSRLYPVGQFPGHPEINGGIDIMIAVSRDGGQSWETKLQENDGILATVIEDPENTSGLPGLGVLDQARLAIGPEGEIYLSNFGGGDFTVHVSRDGGASFDGPVRETEQRIVFGTGFQTNVNADGLPNNRFRTSVMRAIVPDPVRAGQVYAVEPILVLDAVGNQVDGADVFFGRSLDYGESWQTTFAVGPNTASVLNDDNDGQLATGAPDDVISGQAMARPTVDAQGNIGVMWYDTRRDPADHLLDVFGTISTDGGQTFSPNFRITDVSFDADQGSFTNATGAEEFYLGDFIGLAMANNAAYAAWTDTRNGNQDIFFASYSIDPAPEPLNDRFEPNDTPELDTTPTILGRVVQRLVPKLAVSPGDEDWFLVKAAATGEFIASALFASETTVAPNALQVELWDQTATTLLATGTQLVDEQDSVIGHEVRFPSNAGEAFLVRVVGAETGGSPESVSYSLRLQSLTADLGTRAFAGVDGSLPPGGVAVYQVSAAAAGSIQLQLTGGDNVEGDLNLQVVDPQTFGVLVSGEAPPGPSLTAASAEPNDSIGQASPTGLVGAGSVTIDSLIGDGEFGATSGDYDFYSFEAAASQSISVAVDPLGSGLDSMIGLYDSAGNSLEMVDSGGPSDAESLSFMTQTGDTYFVAVMAWATGFPSDPLTPGTGAGVGTTGVFRATIATEALGAGAIEQASLAIQQDQSVLLLVSGEEGSSGDFALEFTNLDQFTTQDNATLLFPAGAGPSATAVADLNGDNNADIVVANALSNTISVLLGNGNGTFQSPRQFTTGAFATPNPVTESPVVGRELAIADLSGDGILDVAVTNFDSSDVSVFLGRGDGTFEPQRRFDATSTPFALDVGDLNGDAVPDLVVADSPLTWWAATVAVLLGRGNGSFQPQQTFEIATHGALPVTGLRLADLNGDETLDLIASGDNDPGIDVFLGNGDGTFTFQGRFDANRQAPDTEVADLDGDGNLDIAVASYAEQGEVSVLLGNGDGTFQQAQDYFAGQSVLAVEIADFGSQVELPDGSAGLGPPDGKVDLVVAASGIPRAIQVVGGPEVVVLPAIFDDQGQFVEFGAPQQLAPAKRPINLDIGDLNNDGSVDVAVVDVDGILVIFGEPPVIVPNDTPETARDLGTVVHLVDQTQTIVPGREDAYYKLTVPTEAIDGARRGDHLQRRRDRVPRANRRAPQRGDHLRYLVLGFPLQLAG